MNSERTPEISRSVSVSKSHRQETRTDLPPGEPAAEPESAREPRVQPGKKWPAKRLWKRRSLRELGNPFGIPTFPQPQQQQAISGYKSNGATWEATVTFSNGLTRGLRATALGRNRRFSVASIRLHPPQHIRRRRRMFCSQQRDLRCQGSHPGDIRILREEKPILTADSTREELSRVHSHLLLFRWPASGAALQPAGTCEGFPERYREPPIPADRKQ